MTARTPAIPVFSCYLVAVVRDDKPVSAYLCGPEPPGGRLLQPGERETVAVETASWNFHEARELMFDLLSARAGVLPIEIEQLSRLLSGRDRALLDDLDGLDDPPGRRSTHRSPVDYDVLLARFGDRELRCFKMVCGGRRVFNLPVGHPGPAVVTCNCRDPYEDWW